MNGLVLLLGFMFLGYMYHRCTLSTMIKNANISD
jgi:hypothetical protein